MYVFWRRRLFLSLFGKSSEIKNVPGTSARGKACSCASGCGAVYGRGVGRSGRSRCGGGDTGIARQRVEGGAREAAAGGSRRDTGGGAGSRTAAAADRTDCGRPRSKLGELALELPGEEANRSDQRDRSGRAGRARSRGGGGVGRAAGRRRLVLAFFGLVLVVGVSVAAPTDAHRAGAAGAAVSCDGHRHDGRRQRAAAAEAGLAQQHAERVGVSGGEDRSRRRQHAGSREG